MSELRLFDMNVVDTEIDTDIEPGIEPPDTDMKRDMKRDSVFHRDIDTDIEPGIELTPTLVLQPDTHMKPGIETPASNTPAPDSPARGDHPFTVEVVRSNRRRRTISAQMHGNVLRISIPNWMSKKEELASVENMVKRFTKKLATEAVDLVGRASLLARAHDLRTPSVIEWNDSLKAVWGLCTPSTGHIRLSTRLVGFPTWVLDYVIVHELAHLHVSGHGPKFWELVHRYPRTERAIGYLIAKSGDSTGESGEGDCHDLTTSDPATGDLMTGDSC